MFRALYSNNSRDRKAKIQILRNYIFAAFHLWQLAFVSMGVIRMRSFLKMEWERDNRHAPEYVVKLLEYYIWMEGLIKNKNVETEDN